MNDSNRPEAAHELSALLADMRHANDGSARRALVNHAVCALARLEMEVAAARTVAARMIAAKDGLDHDTMQTVQRWRRAHLEQ